MTNNTLKGNDITEMRQLGLFASLASLSYVFWLVGGMELVERLAYYGVKTSASLYATAPASEGGLGITMAEFGVILSAWAFLQTFVPVMSGGISDRLGYKETIFASTVIKIIGYLCMAFFPTFSGFFVGAMFLAVGTGIFKPGIQGTLANCTRRDNSSMAWGVFYQIVNIGGFLGPLMAASIRQLSWDLVFFVCAGIISINFLLILTYKEPKKEERLALKAKIAAGEVQQSALWKDALTELKKPIVYWYMLVFAGFWFMFNALFDVLPVYVRDWVDTAVVVNDLFGTEGTQNGVIQFFLGMSHDGLRIMPEGILNLNAGLIMTTCFLFAALSGRFRVLDSMLFGAVASVVSMVLLGSSIMGWYCLLAVGVFSIGEMLISPKKNEFMANIAPEGKKAMYLGFVMLPQGIGWSIEGYWGPALYDMFASKENLSRELLLTRGMDASAIDAIPQGEAFTSLVSYTGESAAALTQYLYMNNDIGMAWYIIGLIGFSSAVGILFYGRWLAQLQHQKPA